MFLARSSLDTALNFTHSEIPTLPIAGQPALTGVGTSDGRQDFLLTTDDTNPTVLGTSKKKKGIETWLENVISKKRSIWGS